MKKIIWLSLLAGLFFHSLAFAVIPPTPEIIRLTATSTSITVLFELNTDTDTDGYYVKYWVEGSSDAWTKVRIPKPTSTTVTSYSYLIRGLDSNTEYKVSLSAYDGDTDESATTSDSITTTAVALDIKMVDTGTVSVSLSEIPSGVETFDVYIGSASGVYEYALTDIDKEGAAVQSGLANGTYYILVNMKDSSGDDLSTSSEVTFNVEDFGTLFSREDIDDGCFIGSSVHSEPKTAPVVPFVLFLLTVSMFSFPYKRVIVGLMTVLVFTSMAQAAETFTVSENILGIKVGTFEPSEDLQAEVYDTIVPVSLFYERRLNFWPWLSADVSAGYSRTDGFAVTDSAAVTGVETELEMIPLSGSLNANWDLDPLITLFAGLGGDYWMFKEKTQYGEKDIDVSGWHAKVGAKLLTGDSTFYARGGILLEACYTSMDRFGRNDVDLGGWTYSAALFYCF